MRPAGKALHVAIAQENDEHDGGKIEGQPVQLGCGDDEDQTHQDGKAEDETSRKKAGGNGAAAGPRVGCVQISIGPAIEGHGTGAGGNHGD